LGASATFDERQKQEKEHEMTDQRVAKATRLLEQQIGGDLDFEKLADEVGLSRHRFHHVFVEQTGETRGNYVRRIRLDAAATRLRWTRERVGEIAIRVGYNSQPSFNKAFTQRYGVTPLQFRRDRERWPNDPTDSVVDKRVRIVEGEGFHCLAKRYVGAPCFVADYWQDFLAILPDGLGRSGQPMFLGLLRDDMRFTPPDRVRYDCCVTVHETFDETDMVARVPGLHRLTIPAAVCVSIRHRGYYAASASPGRRQSISHTYSVLFDEWMPNSRRTFAGEYAIEVYGVPHTRCAPGELECLILAPLM
jgi:AraC family transcriptional regulator